MADGKDSATNTSSPSIQAIDKSSVHRICSGQVVLDLATAVKELVENSLDAGATNVEIKLKEYGKDFIEVTDNGLGIEEKNFKGLALKHHTSKLREFSDLTLVDTFGFRGEALSSLSALSDLVITTQNDEHTTGFKLIFNQDGKLVSQLPAARERGTSVSITNLFYTLPVRYKEFHRNFKKDFTKLCHILYSYSLVNSNVRFNCHNVVGKRKNLLLSTKGNENSCDVITSLFGASQSKNTVIIKQAPITDSVIEEYSLSANLMENFKNLFSISGYISSVVHGCGRSSPDRQFFFVNNRPCDFQKLSRIVNEVYHSYNNHQYPFVLLEIKTEKDCVDINVTPDKRQVMIQQEKLLFALIKSSFKSMFDNMATYYNENTNKTHKNNFGIVSSSPSPLCQISSPLTEQIVPNSKIGSGELHGTEYEKTVDQKSLNLEDSVLSKFRSKYAKHTSSVTCNTETKKAIQHAKLDKFFSITSSKKRAFTKEDEDDLQVKPKKPFSLNSSKVDYDDLCCDVELPVSTILPEPKPENNGSNNEVEDVPNTTNEKCDTNLTVIDVDGNHQCFLKGRVNVSFSLTSLKNMYCKYLSKHSERSNAQKQEITSFRAKISPSDNNTAEEELRKHVGKDMFLNMKVLGQFNLGFIISKLDNDLFIIDQHATDEKYNFETLQQKHVLKTQYLIQPVTLEITPAQEIVLLDNIEIFKKNGFGFDISEAIENHIVKLISVPTNRNWTFGVSDVEELIFMLSDSPGVTCRPSRVRQMFASRACRTSIMVGTALNVQTMKKLLTHMGEISHPWNCPHGRPTMRHLINLLRLESN